jgi:hypothetical protein
MATLHINVPNQLGISGTIPMPMTSANTTYTCPLGTFTISPTVTATGSGSTLKITGTFSLSGVGDNYGTVTFNGTYVRRGGNGSGNVSWTGTHLPRSTGGTDTWTSDTTIPEHGPKATKGKAKAKAKAS